MNHSELAQLASSLETSIEVMEVIADKASGDKATMLKIWDDGDKDLEVLAFASVFTEEDELNWGEKTIYRFSEDVRNFVAKHIHTKDDGHDFMPGEIKEHFKSIASSRPHLLAEVREWVWDSFEAGHQFENLTAEDELALSNEPAIIAACAARYIIGE